MSRTYGAWGIVGWQRHMLMRDIAAGELNPDEIAERHGIPTQSVYTIRSRRRAELQAILDDWANEFSDLWSVKKHNRVARLEYLANELQARLDELKADADAATETMRKVHPDAGPVRVPMREWRALTREQAKLLDQICREMGQDAATIDRIAGDAATPTKLRLLGLTPPDRVRAEKEYLTGVDEESPPADLSGFTYSGAGMTVTETIAAEVAEEQRHIERDAEAAYAKRWDELLQQHGITEDLSYLDRWVPPHVEDAVKAAEAQFAEDYPDAVPVVAAVVVEPASAPVDGPVQASEPVPVQAVESAPVAVEKPADEPVPELAAELVSDNCRREPWRQRVPELEPVPVPVPGYEPYRVGKWTHDL
jgi:hypothetical protein